MEILSLGTRRKKRQVTYPRSLRQRIRRFRSETGPVDRQPAGRVRKTAHFLQGNVAGGCIPTVAEPASPDSSFQNSGVYRMPSSSTVCYLDHGPDEVG